jgi:hypothetical protein
MTHTPSRAARARFALAASLAALASLYSAPAARAFCRETTSTSSDGPCVEDPSSKRLVWKRSCMTYVFNREVFGRLELLDEASIRDQFQRSFDAWADVDCGDDKAPFFVEQSQDVTDTDASEFREDVVNESVIIARTREEWAENELSSNVIALTVLWHDRNTGEIFDVDMQLNTGIGDFTDCRDECRAGEIDLRNTVTHEAGHLLGLGHSKVAGSTMFDNNASPGDIEKRTLEADDEAGYCSLDLPSFKCKGGDCECPAPDLFSSTQTVKTCGCAVPGAGAPPGGLAAGVGAVLCALLGRRARRGRAQRGKCAA